MVRWGVQLLPEGARRLAAWCVVILLAAGVGWVGILLCGEFRTAVVPVLLALLGTALLGPLYRRMLKMRVNQSPAAALTCVAVAVVVGGAVYIVVAALIHTGGQIVTSLRQAARSVAEHFGAAGTSLDDLAAHSKDLLAKFGGTAAANVISGVSVVGETLAMAVLGMLFAVPLTAAVFGVVHELRALYGPGGPETPGVPGVPGPSEAP